MMRPWRFWRAASMPLDALARRSPAVQWPRIRARLDAGRLTQVGLVRHHGSSPFELSRDHQVLAWGYAETPGSGTAGSGAITLRLYDPNWPDRDDVTVTLSADGHAQNTGEQLMGVIALYSGWVGSQPVNASLDFDALASHGHVNRQS